MDSNEGNPFSASPDGSRRGHRHGDCGCGAGHGPGRPSAAHRRHRQPGPNHEIPAPAFRQAIAALAGPCQQDGSEAGSWRNQLQRFGPADGSQGADHRRRFRYGKRARRSPTLAKAADVAISYLPADGGAGRARGGRADQAPRGGPAWPIPGDLRDSRRICKAAGRRDRVRRASEVSTFVVNNAGRQQSARLDPRHLRPISSTGR